MDYKKIFFVFILFFLLQNADSINNYSLWQKAVFESVECHYNKSNEIVNIKLENLSSKSNKLLANTNKSNFKDKIKLDINLRNIKYTKSILYRVKIINCFNLDKYKEAYEAIDEALTLEKNDIVLMMLKFLTENKLGVKNIVHNKLKTHLLSHISTKKTTKQFFYFLLSRYFLFHGDIEKSSIAIKKGMQRYTAHNRRNNIIFKEVYLLYYFLQYLQGQKISETELENLTKGENHLSEATNVNYHYFKAIIYYDQGYMKNTKKEFSKAKSMIKEKNMEYDYNMENLYNIFPEKYRKKLKKIENLITNHPQKH